MLLDDDDDEDDDADDDDIIGSTRWLWAISKIWKIWDLTCKISSSSRGIKIRHPLELYIDMGSNM